MTNVLKVPFRKLKHIHHISDIQIRNLKRHREYEEVFNRLYEKVKEYPDNAIAYIGGDIAHSKTEMSPELIDQLSRLFKNLSDLTSLINKLLVDKEYCSFLLKEISNNFRNSKKSLEKSLDKIFI